MINDSLKPIITDRSLAISELIKQWVLKDRQVKIEKPDSQLLQPGEALFKLIK